MQDDSISKQAANTGSRSPFSTGLRRINPLSQYSSYTYNLSLYMLTPEAMNYYISSGSLPPTQASGRYIIIAQGGGINPSQPRGLTSDLGTPPGPNKSGLDYYIDDLTFETAMLGADGSRTATADTEFSFKVIEPIGFTFLTKLTNASNNLNTGSNLIQASVQNSRPNLYQQHYMIGIRFYGYDRYGNMVESSNVQGDGVILGDKYAIHERLIPLVVRECKFRIDGKATIYNFGAVMIHQQAAMGKKFGLMPNQANLEGSTIGEIIGSSDKNNPKSLIGWLNSIQKDRTDNKNQAVAVNYDVNWLKTDWFNADVIYNSPLISQEPSQQTAPMARVNYTGQGTVKASSRANTIDIQSRSINFAGNTPIVAAIDQIIVKSKYVADTLSKEVNERIEAETKDNSRGKLVWYYIKPIVKINGRDSSRNDWIYDVTYEIGPYEIPYIKSPYVNERSKYYGPVKAYEYTLTGKNTEVLSFQMEYNNIFYVQVPATTTKDDPNGKKSSVSSSTPRAATSSIASNPTLGPVNNGGAIAESVRANLYSLGDQAQVSIKIMGDPDYIMDTMGTETKGGTYSKFYGKNNSINPYGGQIFIEISFKVAEDYKDDGLLDVGVADSIAFYPIDKQKVIGNQGYVYKIRKVTSNFAKGKFEQTLDCYMVPINELLIDDKQESRQESREEVRKETAAIRKDPVKKPPPKKADNPPLNKPEVRGPPVPQSSNDDNTVITGYEAAFVTLGSEQDMNGRNSEDTPSWIKKGGIVGGIKRGYNYIIDGIQQNRNNANQAPRSNSLRRPNDFQG